MIRKRTYRWNPFLSFLQLFILVSCSPHSPSYLSLWRYELSLVIGQKPLHSIFNEKCHLRACSSRWLSFLNSSCRPYNSELLQKWPNANPKNSVDYSVHLLQGLNVDLYPRLADSSNLYHFDFLYDSCLTLSILLRHDDTGKFFQEWK
jgi:hypothetical protein